MKKILVAGSNRDGNDKAKENAIALLKDPDLAFYVDAVFPPEELIDTHR